MTNEIKNIKTQITNLKSQLVGDEYNIDRQMELAALEQKLEDHREVVLADAIIIPGTVDMLLADGRVIRPDGEPSEWVEVTSEYGKGIER